METIEIKHFHLFCGLGGGAVGFNGAQARIKHRHARFKCLGGVDVDPAAVRDFQQLTGVEGTVLDLFSKEQYKDFHGVEPPAGWKECMPDDIRRAAGYEKPNILFQSSPCKGYSGLLAQEKSKTRKYQALNELTLRGNWLTLEAWKDDPIEFLIMENVPRILTRGRHLLDQITALLTEYGYAVSETTHDCGELGGLAQSRKRFLLVARHQEKVPPFLYEPTKKPLISVGKLLDRMPLPGDDSAGPMHRIPRLQWKTWVRLAFIEAGSDWRSLNRLNIEDGFLKDYCIVPEYHSGYLGINHGHQTTGTIAGRSTPTNGKFSVADPRHHKTRHNNVYRVVSYDERAGTITAGLGPSSGGQSVADPRGTCFAGKYHITPFTSETNTVIAGSTTGQGAFAVADPRSALNTRTEGDHYLTGGHYGVLNWADSSGAVSSAACHDNGKWSVADPRLPEANDQLIAVIQSTDNTWHRPFTTFELAAIQGLIDPEEQLELDGLSDSSWRERIGNAVPPPAAKAIASVIGEALLLAWSGETFLLGSTPIWVRPIATAIALPSAVGKS